MIYINDKEVNLIYNLGEKVKEVFSYGTKIWPKEVLFDYMYFKLADGYTSGNVSYQFSEYYNLHNKYLKISTDGSNWSDWTEAISMTPNVKYYVKGEDSYVRNSDISGGFFTSDVSTQNFSLECGGDVMSLCNNATEITTNYCFYGLFYNMTNLFTPPELPATTLADHCYEYMFYGCSSLTKAPALPATTLKYYGYSSMFFGCKSLTQAPELPATTLAGYCYEYMFKNCSSLTQAPSILPATTLTSSCYDEMFYNCRSLTKAPELPATTLADSCYMNMFNDCSKLTKAPSILPATTLELYCYKNMFSGCSSLTQAPELLATTLADRCYEYMFDGCSSLTKAPALPATTLKYMCYYYMFYGCKSLTEAPELPATTFENYCYSGMFYNANKLNWIKALFTTTPITSYTGSWVNGVSAQGVFVKSIDADWTTTGVNAVPTGWSVIYFDQTEGKYYTTKTKEVECDKYGNVKQEIDAMYFKLADGYTSGNVSYKFDEYYNFHNKYLKYSTDGNNWTDWTEQISMTPNTKYFVKGEDDYVRNTNVDISGVFFTSDVSQNNFNIECGGNVMSLCNMATEITTQYCFFMLFENMTNLLTPPALPATTLADLCYTRMFTGCSSLTQAPELPATTLATNCYSAMFNGCSSLTQAPALPATTLADSCYSGMFENCSSLTQAPSLPATTLTYDCYSDMFMGCSSLIKAPVLTATTLSSYCYNGMFSDCTSLAEITLNGDFKSSYANNWVRNVSTSGTFYNNSDLDIPVGVNGIPTGWKEIRPVTSYYMYFKLADGAENGNVSYQFEEYYNLHNKYLKISTDVNNWQDWTEAISMTPNTKYYVKGEDSYVRNSNISGGFFTSDVIQNNFNIECGGNVMSLCNLATEITTNYCFRTLFYNMTNLLTPPKLPATTLASNCYSSMFNGCTSLTEAPALPATTLASNCYYGMFTNCSSLTQAPELPATTLANSCYNGMFFGCTSLTEAPELPATRLAANCYSIMFKNSNKLNWIKALFNDKPQLFNTNSWVNGVSSQGVFVKSIEANWTTTGVNAVPTGWTVIYYDQRVDAYFTTQHREEECDKYGNPLY